jgi:hypothetical protein
MIRCAWAAVGLLAAGLAAAEPTDWKVLASAGTVGKQEWPLHIDPVGDKPRHGVACRGPADLTALVVKDPKLAAAADEQKRAEAWAARLLKVEKIDWTKQMVVAVDAGSVGNGREVKLVSAKADGQTLTVTWQTLTKAKSGLANPRLVALMPRFEGDVVFVEKRGK